MPYLGCISSQERRERKTRGRDVKNWTIFAIGRTGVQRQPVTSTYVARGTCQRQLLRNVVTMNEPRNFPVRWLSRERGRRGVNYQSSMRAPSFRRSLTSKVNRMSVCHSVEIRTSKNRSIKMRARRSVEGTTRPLSSCQLEESIGET